jgi:hypothetical protein
MTYIVPSPFAPISISTPVYTTPVYTTGYATSRIKSVEYFENGLIKRIEYYDDGAAKHAL